MEAEAGVFFDSASLPPIATDMIERTQFYSHDREIGCPYYGVANASFIHL
jgi:hypothetical protein